MAYLDPKNSTDLSRLKSSIEWSNKQMEPRRIQRANLLRKLVGQHYGTDGSPDARPVNMIELATDIFQRGLASHQPQAIVETDFEELVPTTSDFEIVLNRRIKKINLRDSLNICAVEALFSIGVMCVGVAIDGQYDSGSAFAEPVLFPNLILDCNAESWDQMAYVGHYFYVPLSWIKENDSLDEKTRRQFVSNTQARFSNSGEQDWKRPTGEVYEQMICLQQVYLRHENRVVLLAPDGQVDGALSDEEWKGPYCGPYMKLAFRSIPGNLFPLAPAVQWWDLDNIVNRSFVKAFEQSDRCKTLTLAMQGDDAAAVKAGGDGEVVGVSDPGSVVEKSYGGANQSVVSMANAAMALLKQMAGNLDSLGGLAPSSGTVGQDQLLAQGANGRMKDMQATMTEFEEEVVSSLAFWVWEDPTGEERFTKRLEGTSYGIESVWSKDNRSGEFFQLNLSVNPYARVNRSPSEQAQFILQILESVIIPSAQLMQPGSPIDWEYLFKMLARYNNAPEINMLINWPQGESEPGPMPDTPGKPNNTTRTYQRVNTQGGPQNPVDAAMQQLVTASGQNGQPQLAQAG